MMSIVFFVVSGYKAAHHKPEWILLLIILSYIKTCITYLFEASTVFTVVTIGTIQIHLDDIILLWLLGYCCIIFIHAHFQRSIYTKSILLLVIPISISLFRGIAAGSIGSAAFLADTRKYVLFLLVLIGFFFSLRKPEAIQRLSKYEKYIHQLMNVVLVYVFVIWALDLFLGMRSLPGQINGTLSDGGSTFRIINPPQAMMIAFYALSQLYKDLIEKKFISIRTLLFMFMVILLQWRTVVAAFVVAVVLLIIKAAANGKIFSVKLGVEIILVTLAGVAVSISMDISLIVDMVENLFTSFANVGNGTGTFATRTSVWTMLLSSLSGINVFLGRPFGAVNAASVTWAASAHSGYVDYIMTVGYIGLLCLILFMAILIIGAHRTGNDFMSIALIALLVYWYAYGFSLEQGAVLGVCLAILYHSSRKVGDINES